MKNYNIYDPMKRGQGLVLDGQTLAHVEVSAQTRNKFMILVIYDDDETGFAK